MFGGVKTCQQRYQQFATSLTQLQLDTSKVLGSGRYGLVMKGWLTTKSTSSPTRVSTAVAVKTISSADDATTTQLLLEMRLLAAMRHPNLVALVAVQEVQLPLLLVMELCEGGDLCRCLRLGLDHLREIGLRSSVSLEAAYLDFASQAAAGIAYLHSKLCVHRDIAARNLLVKRSLNMEGSGLELKLADLGLARIVLSEEDYYKVGQGVSLFPFFSDQIWYFYLTFSSIFAMSQSTREDDAVPLRWQCPVAVTTRSYTTKSDVYSFGVLLWEIYHHGSTPFAEVPISDVVRVVQSGGQLAWRCDPAAPADIINIMRCCTRLDPAQRPGMAGLVRTLRCEHSGEPMTGDEEAVGMAFGVEGAEPENESVL